VAGASGYQVWRNGSPYFAPALPCQGANCSAVTTTNTTQSGLGSAATNYTWLVQPKATCGAVQLTPSNRVGEFEFDLAQGAP
jgi:hypothetical protein